MTSAGPDGAVSAQVSAATSLADLIGHAAEHHPESGIIDNDGTFLSWPVVNTQVSALAARLIEARVKPGDRVAVHHPRSAASFIAVHAIVRAGAVMVPLDPMGPPEGVAAVIDAIEPAAIVGAAATLARHDGASLAASSMAIICNGAADALVETGLGSSRLIDFAEATTSTGAASNAMALNGDDPAYIIFTSGSTGVPKGIVHTHASALAYAKMGVTAHDIVDGDRLAAIAPLHFDQSTLDLYAAPLAGATVVMTSEAELRFPASLTTRLEAHRVSLVYTTPYQLQQLVDRGDLANRDLSAVRQLAFGGEAFAPQALVELGRVFPTAELINVYGPAEVNGVTVHSFGHAPSTIESVPIGLACQGVQIVLVDDADNEVAMGESGEILVHSPTAMRGYWRRPDLNQACFVERNGATYYRTGDVAHIDAEHRLQFEGRSDNRIKVRGVRIDLEAIERVLEDAPGVTHAVAARVDDESGQRIEASIVAAQDDCEDAAIIRWCRAHLPANAVPVALHRITAVPMTATGKIDRASLRDAVAARNADPSN